MSTKLQPIGVRVVAILYFVTTTWFVALLVLLLSSRSTLERLLNGLAVAGEHPLLRLGALLPLYFSAMALVVGAIGWGLWRYRNWARLLTLLLLAVSLIVTGWQAVESLENLRGSDLVRIIVGIIPIGLATWYFTRKRVRQAFGRA